jgi:hypothetical protein
MRLRGNPMHDVEETKVYALSEFPPKDL